MFIDLKKQPRSESLLVVFFVTACLCLVFISYYDLTERPQERVMPGTGAVAVMTDGQKEVRKRAEVIQKVLQEGKLELTPARYYRTGEEAPT